MADVTVTPKAAANAALWRGIRTTVAIGLPILLSYLAGHPDARWAGVAPIIMAIGKYLRGVYKWDWIPV